MRVYGDDSPEWVKVYVSNDPNSGWEFAHRIRSVGTKSVYIGGTSYDEVRYIKFVNPSQRKTVEIDAVRGKCIKDQVEEVPEFGTIAAAVLLAGVGLFIYKRREN